MLCNSAVSYGVTFDVGNITRAVDEEQEHMMTAVDTFAVGCVTTWAGTTRVRASAAGVREVWLPDWHGEDPPVGSVQPVIHVERGDGDAAERHLKQALEDLAEYFAGRRHIFTVVLDPRGPAFFRTIWDEVARVPYGETRAYGEIARMLGEPDAARAVGAANGANPVAPFVPCHRIVGSDGQLTGYGPGLALKQRLLVMEGAVPADAGNYDAWTAYAAARLAIGSEALLIGVRSAGTYCRPNCARARRSLRPNRIFRAAGDAEAAGFHACDRCQSGRTSGRTLGLWEVRAAVS
jgi:methylated-DNA-[protein]-cysteine S-methyltransferase